MLLFAAQGQALAYQMSDPQPQRGIEAFDMLCPADHVQPTKNDAFIGTQAVGMTHGIEIRGREALPQPEGSSGISVSDETADDLAGGAVHGEPDPDVLCLLRHKGASLVTLQDQRG